jgi:hypothetical protein
LVNKSGAEAPHSKNVSVIAGADHALAFWSAAVFRRFFAVACVIKTAADLAGKGDERFSPNETTR